MEEVVIVAGGFFLIMVRTIRPYPVFPCFLLMEADRHFYF
jgi:hypothetical protein